MPTDGLLKLLHDAGGDMWLEAKGKANAPGPEQLRGRQNLFETFQQSSNPYIDGALMVLAMGGKCCGFRTTHTQIDNCCLFLAVYPEQKKMTQ